MFKKIFSVVCAWIAAIVGTPIVLIALGYLYKLDQFIFGRVFPTMRDDDKGIAAVMTVVITLGVGLFFTAIVIDNDSNAVYTTHKCNICKERLKIGEGAHRSLEDGSCFCVCDKCKPTVVFYDGDVKPKS